MGRSPLSNGSVTVSASARVEAKPVASAATPARFINSRRSIIWLPPKLLGLNRSSPELKLRVVHRQGAQVKYCFGRKRLRRKSTMKIPAASRGDRDFQTELSSAHSHTLMTRPYGVTTRQESTTGPPKP